MNRTYFLIFIGILVFSAAAILYFGGNFFGVYGNRTIVLQNSENNTALVLNTTELNPQSKINIIFVGDIMLSRGVAYQIKKHNDFNYPFLKIADTIKSADLAFANLEGPISGRGKNQGSIYSFSYDPQIVQGLKFTGFAGLFLANNHIWDWGREAFNDTIDILNKNGIYPIGIGRNEVEANMPLILNIKNTKLAFLSFTTLLPKSLEAKGGEPGTTHFDVDKIKNKIQELKQTGLADLVVVSFHWGTEYQKEVSEEQKHIAHELADAGADLIIGHHPHVVEEFEHYNNTWIAYSLGNFVFDQNFSEETMGGAMLNVKIKGGKIDEAKLMKIKISDTFQPELP